MSVPIAVIPLGARVRIQRGAFPIDPAIVGRTGTVVESSEYRPHCYGVVLDDDVEARTFALAELELLDEASLPPDRAAAQQRRALP
jgi:hypothetical protein